MDEKLTQYIKRNIEKGHHPDKIRQVLINAGHHPGVVEEHINHVRNIHSGNKQNKKTAFIALAVIFILVLGISLFNSSEEGPGEKSEVKIDYEKEVATLNSALVGSDSSACDGLNDAEFKKTCLQRFSNEVSAECDEACKNKELLNMALINKNATICKEITDNATKNTCVNIVK